MLECGDPSCRTPFSRNNRSRLAGVRGMMTSQSELTHRICIQREWKTSTGVAISRTYCESEMTMRSRLFGRASEGQRCICATGDEPRLPHTSECHIHHSARESDDDGLHVSDSFGAFNMHRQLCSGDDLVHTGRLSMRRSTIWGRDSITWPYADCTLTCYSMTYSCRVSESDR